MANKATDLELLNAVKESTEKLSNASKWSDNISLKFADSFLLELFLLFRILVDLQTSYVVKYIPGCGKTAHAFPQSGAAKKGRPKFQIIESSSGRIVAQICAGTKVDDIDGNSRAIDVSIQNGEAGDQPKFSDLIIIYDAKYRKNSTSRLTSHEFSEFARWIDLMQLQDNVLIIAHI